jgi:hypothetical protein
MEEPRLSAEFNELGFWAMPKILPDWKRSVELADEITLKHYYHNRYRPEMGRRIKDYAGSLGKRVWVHCVMNLRVSAFMYHYLKHACGYTEAAARSPVLPRWEPRMDEVWKEFMALDPATVRGRP